MPEEALHSEELDILAMQRLTAGEDRALNELMDRWSSRVMAYLLRMTGSESAAADLAQETFVRLYQTRMRFQPHAHARKGKRPESQRPFSIWLFGIAANLGRNHLRWIRRHPTLSLEEADEVEAGDHPGLSVESQERGRTVRAAIATLPSDLREVVILSEYEDLPQAGIARIAGCSVKAVERRLSRAREILRTNLRKYLQGT